MRAWELETVGIDGLKLKEQSPVDLKAGFVRVAMKAGSINYRDLLMVRGQYDPRMKLPLIPLSDGAGEVIEVGADVTRFQVGDRVIGSFAPKWIAGPPRTEWIRHTRGGPLPGMLTEQHVCPAEALVRAPEYLDDVSAATLPCAALTAWSALVEHGGVRPGQTILVQGTGGVSLFALQIGVMLGARVIVTSSKDEKLERAKAMGAFATINYVREKKWGTQAAELAGGGVDLVVEVGGGGTFAQSQRAVRPGGTIALIGVLSGVATEVSLVRILMSQVRVQGILVGHRTGLEEMIRAFEAHRVEPVVDRVFGFDEAPDALRHLESAAHFGKVGVRIG